MKTEKALSVPEIVLFCSLKSISVEVQLTIYRGGAYPASKQIAVQLFQQKLEPR
jgi:hypothetical protein